ncbi:CotS family spore coat protein [Clostridium algoriphilum]|uniref:CotS family spore coat protein n=1 Tax=Clostridium algoriphilum TaxID=198347 RepID=UPI001CF2B9D6|nr:CotS family spore coat protein [Clostridium algoriphilum]MCB2292117.1 CotS family spore coat protein [Clostridium algoriphilum]
MKGNSIILERSKEISSKEMQILISVIHKYNLELISAEKVRNSYMIITNNGKFCLKRRKHGKTRIRNECILTQELLLNDFTNIAKYFKTNDASFSVSYKKSIYFLKEWIEGSECDLTNIDEAVNCIKLLAQFHNISKKVDHNKIYISKKIKNLPKSFSHNLSNMEKLERIIVSKRIKNEFDILYLENANDFYYRGIAAIDILNKSQYYKLLKSSIDNKLICHNSFYYQNIIKKDGKYFIIDLDSISIDLQICDLGKLIRRLMFKKAYVWNFYFAKALIEAYSSINKLSKEDLNIILALITFPYSFFKLGRKRYIKHKKWSETKYLHKLSKITKYNEIQQKFFNDYSAYVKEYI